MKNKNLSIVNLILQGCFLLSCLIPFMEENDYKKNYSGYYYSYDSVWIKSYSLNLFSSIINGLSFIAFVILMLCFVAVILIHIADVTNSNISFLTNNKVIAWKNRLWYILPCAEITFSSACMLGWENDYWSSDNYYTIYTVNPLAVIPFFLLFAVLCIAELSRRNTQQGNLTEKKAIAGLILRIIGLLGILAGTIIHASDYFIVGGFFYIGGAVIYLVGRFFSGIPAEEMPAAPAVEDETASTQTESEAIEVPASQDAPQAAETAKGNGADEIRKYKALLDDGIITQEEFDAKKKQVLGL